MKKVKIDRRGLHFRLYAIFVLFTAAIIVLIGFVQFFAIKKQTREDTRSGLQRAARNISAAYGTNAYLSTIRSVIYSEEYVVRAVMENGEILVDTDELSVYIRWPDISLDISEIQKMLDDSEGYFYIEEKDSANVTWIVYGQVVASWNGEREILLVTTDTSLEKEQIRNLMTLFLKTAAIGMLIAFFVCWFAAKTYLKPIKEITGRAKLLSNGDYSVSFPRGSYTEIDMLSETLDLAVDQFANYEQMRRDMIANVSHDMRTPLTMIKAYAEMIENISGDNPEKRKEHLDVIISQTDKLSEFVSASLYLGKLQSGTVELHCRVFSLDEHVKAIVAQIEALDNGKHKFCVEAEPHSIVKADAGRIEQIIINLVNNSMKYGGDTITVRVRHICEKVRMEIIDNGSGIPEDKIHMVWTRYFCINPNDKDAGNTGVGLSIVKEIADLHGMEYGVESPDRAGTRFWFDLPYAG